MPVFKHPKTKHVPCQKQKQSWPASGFSEMEQLFDLTRDIFLCVDCGTNGREDVLICQLSMGNVSKNLKNDMEGS